MLSWLDWTILAIIGLSTLLSLKRGFVKEALSLAAWVAAFLVSTTFAGRLSVQLSEYITHDAFRYASAYVILFAATLMLGSLLNRLLAQLIKATGLSGADRVLGTVFGCGRGLVVVVVMLYVLQAILTQEEQEFMRQSRLLPHLEVIVQWAQQNFADVTIDGKVPWL